MMLVRYDDLIKLPEGLNEDHFYKMITVKAKKCKGRHTNNALRRKAFYHIYKHGKEFYDLAKYNYILKYIACALFDRNDIADISADILTTPEEVERIIKTDLFQEAYSAVLYDQLI